MDLSKLKIAAIIVLASAVVYFGVGGWALSFVEYKQENAHEINCQNDGKGCALALHHYIQEHGTFPPSTVNINGAIHSWRVLVSKHLDSDAHLNYDYEKAWDSPENLKLQDTIPTPLTCPSRNRTANPYSTSYVAVTGPNCVMRDDSYPPRKLAGIESTTIVLVETQLNDIHWMSSVDLDYAKLKADLEYAKKVLGGPHAQGGHYVTVDGQVGRIDEIGIPAVLNRMFVPLSAGVDAEPTD